MNVESEIMLNQNDSENRCFGLWSDEKYGIIKIKYGNLKNSFNMLETQLPVLSSFNAATSQRRNKLLTQNL